MHGHGSQLHASWRQPSPVIMGLSATPGVTLKGQCFKSAWMAGSANFLPMRRLASNTVLVGLLATCTASKLVRRDTVRQGVRQDDMQSVKGNSSGPASAHRLS